MNINNINIISLLPNEEQCFRFDSASSELIFKEIFLKVALDDYEGFKKLCNLPLPWLEEFRLNNSYELNKNNDDYELCDYSEVFSNFFNAAAVYFPDKYSYYVLRNMLPILNESSTNKKDQFIKEVNQCLASILINSKNETLQELLKNNLTCNDKIIRTAFQYPDELKDFINQLMKNENLQDYILEQKKEERFQSIFFSSLNKRMYDDKTLNNTINHIDDAYNYMPTKKQKVTENILTILNNNTNYRGYIDNKWSEVLLHLLVEGRIEIHSNYCTKTYKIIDDNNVYDPETNTISTSVQTIEKRYNLDSKFIENIYKLRAEKLNQKLTKTDDTKKVVSKI